MSFILNNESVESNDKILSLALYGYGCFTALAVDNGEVKGFKYHIDRLLNDSKELFGVSPSEYDIRENIKEFIKTQGEAEHIIVRVTLFPNEFSIAVPEKISSINIMVTGRALSSVSGKPMRLSTVDTNRILPFQKTTNMISNLKARAIAHQSGYDDAVMIQGNQIKEGATWNIFFGRENEIVTPSLSVGILPGVTRKIIINSQGQLGYSIREDKINLDSLKSYQYCFATNAAIGIAPVQSIDDVQFDSSNENLSILFNKYRLISGERVI